MSSLFSDRDTPPKRAPKPRNLVYEHIRAVWFEGIDAKCTRSRIGKLTRNFAELCGDVTPEEAIAEIDRRREVYKRTWPMMSETPEALFKNWSQMAARVEKLATNMNAEKRKALRIAEERLMHFKSMLTNPQSQASHARNVEAFKSYSSTLGAFAQDDAIRNIIIDIRVLL